MEAAGLGGSAQPKAAAYIMLYLTHCGQYRPMSHRSCILAQSKTAKTTKTLSDAAGVISHGAQRIMLDLHATTMTIVVVLRSSADTFLFKHRGDINRLALGFKTIPIPMFSNHS